MVQDYVSFLVVPCMHKISLEGYKKFNFFFFFNLQEKEVGTGLGGAELGTFFCKSL